MPNQLASLGTNTMPETYRHPASIVKGKEKNEKARRGKGEGKDRGRDDGG